MTLARGCGYFIVATVLRAPYCAPIPFCARATLLPVIRRGLSGSETAATSSCDCRLLSPAVSGSVPATRRNESAGYRDGTFNHRRRYKAKAMRFATFISARLMPLPAAFPARLYRIRHIHRAQCVGARSISAIAVRPSPSPLTRQKQNAHLVTFDQGNGSTESLAVPVTRNLLAVLKGDQHHYRTAFEQWRGVE